MIESFIRGLLAGYGIAIPVGAIAVLIMDTGMRRGFRHGFAAGAEQRQRTLCTRCPRLPRAG
jgi:arginine exporter protein ArgO